jgi:hypothetical protein
MTTVGEVWIPEGQFPFAGLIDSHNPPIVSPPYTNPLCDQSFRDILILGTTGCAHSSNYGEVRGQDKCRRVAEQRASRSFTSPLPHTVCDGVVQSAQRSTGDFLVAVSKELVLSRWSNSGLLLTFETTPRENISWDRMQKGP